jgi:DNA repair protein RadC
MSTTPIGVRPTGPDSAAASSLDPQGQSGGARRRTRPTGRTDAERSGAAPQRSAVRCDRCRRDIPLPGTQGPRLSDPDSVAALVVPLIGTADREHCLAVLLDTKHRVLSTVTVSIGSLDHTFMSPREIMRDALLANAAACVLVHNHPSGDPEPSRDDERVTRRLVEAGRLVGVEILDHLVVGGGTWVSLARRGFV